jgi:hypothetical protein
MAHHVSMDLKWNASADAVISHPLVQKSRQVGHKESYYGSLIRIVKLLPFLR